MTAIFISYRRDDAAGFAGRITDALEREFGADAVFRDQDDIGAGEDFVAALDKALAGFSVMLVVIGPAWLHAMVDGRRRLDKADDFVRLEVQRGLESGKTVFPVLVAGAAMPAESELPPALAALARRQAIALADSDWPGGIQRLVAAIRPLLAAPSRAPTRRHYLLLGALTLTLAGAAIGLKVLAPSPVEQATTLAISGRWQARVVYDWGDAHDEVFDLQFAGGGVTGSASYLRLPRPITNGTRQGKTIRFSTQSREVLSGSPERDVRHDYHGEVSDETLRLRLQTSGGHSPHPPVDFVARRLP